MASISNYMKTLVSPARLRAALRQRRIAADLALGVRSRRDAFRGPLEIQIGISNRCNNRCVMCWSRPGRAGGVPETSNPDVDDFVRAGANLERLDMPFETFDRLTAELAAMGTEKVLLIGRGEPLLHPRAADMVENTVGKGLLCMLCTNGVLLDRSLMRELIRVEPDEISISLNAGTKESYDKIHRPPKKDAFENILDAASFAAGEKKKRRKKKPEMTFSFVLSSDNGGEIIDMARVAAECGVNKVSFAFVVCVSDEYASLLMSDERHGAAVEQMKAAKKLLDAHGVINNASNIIDPPHLALNTRYQSGDYFRRFPCYAGWTFSIVCADGTVNPCCSTFLDFGNVNDRSFMEIWNGEKYRAFREKLLALPSLDGKIPGCLCDNCSFVNTNAEYHAILEKFDRKKRRRDLRRLKQWERFAPRDLDPM